MSEKFSELTTTPEQRHAEFAVELAELTATVSAQGEQEIVLDVDGEEMLIFRPGMVRQLSRPDQYRRGVSVYQGGVSMGTLGSYEEQDQRLGHKAWFVAHTLCFDGPSVDVPISAFTDGKIIKASRSGTTYVANLVLAAMQVRYTRGREVMALEELFRL